MGVLPYFLNGYLKNGFLRLRPLSDGLFIRHGGWRDVALAGAGFAI